MPTPVFVDGGTLPKPCCRLTGLLHHRSLLPGLCAVIGLAFAPTGFAKEPHSARSPAVQPLANDYVTIFESSDPDHIRCASPGLTRLNNGRLVASLDLAGIGLADLPGTKGKYRTSGNLVQGKVFTSDDHGQTWEHRADFPFRHARPFEAGDAVYVIGEDPDLCIIRSVDGGQTWSPSVRLSRNEYWHQAPCNVHYANGAVYLVMEKMVHPDIESWPVSIFAPVLMRGDLNKDLSLPENWTFASTLSFRDAVKKPLDMFGVPFFTSLKSKSHFPAPGRPMAPMGWLETNVVQFTDPSHYWHDPKGKTFHLWMRAHTGGTGLAAIAKVVENDDGSMNTMLEQVPSGKTMLYVPCPGGQMKFHVLWDEPSERFWLLSTQATDSMTRADRLPADRFELPNNERQRLQLHFSRNCIDWCFAGLVATGDSHNESRHYASMTIDGDHLHIASRSGDHRADSAHNCNLITFHTVKNFRDLVY